MGVTVFMALEALAGDLVFALGFVLIIAFVAAAATAAYAQQRVANTIELGVQGIVGVDTLQEVERAHQKDENRERDGGN